jgi:galactokinase
MLDPNVIRERFRRHYAVPPELIVAAPGRVNLLGEHTDYNDGFVLPVAIDRATCVAARPRADRQVRVRTAQFDQSDSFSLDQIVPNADAPWSNYVRGVVQGLLDRGLPLRGVDLLIDSDIPLGSGLSSSAALEVAVGYALQRLNRQSLPGEELALLAQAAENQFVGVQCGIMDQFIVTLGQAEHALLIDTRDLGYELVPLPSSVRVVVCDSRVERTLAGSAYNQRRAECAEAVQLLQPHLPHISALRDVTPDDLARYADMLPPLVQARARHVVSENARTLTGAAALRAGNPADFGQCMRDSHTSLRDDYAVSIEELDVLVAAATSVPGCYGSRLTGAGFGGCTVSLVDAGAVEVFRSQVAAAYQEACGRTAAIYVCAVSAGVRQVE